MVRDTHNGKDLKDDKARASENSKMFHAGPSPEDTKDEVANMADGTPSEVEMSGSDVDDTVASLKEELQKKNQELESLKDVMLRRQADFENYKKRVIKSQDEYRKYAIRDLSQDIITVNDDLLRAMAAASEPAEGRDLEKSHAAFIDGVSLISRNIEDVLKKYGVVEIESLNKEYDPSRNEAVEIEQSESVSIPTISKVYLKGFALDDMIVRPARVRVTMPVARENGGPDKGAGPVDKKA